MKYVHLALNWILGILFLLTGIVSIIEVPLAGLFLVAVSLLLLPPARNYVYSKTNIEIPAKARAVSIFVLIVASFIFFLQTQIEKAQEWAAQQTKEEAEQAAQLRQQNIAYFQANREQIISSVKDALSAKEYQSVISQSEKYLESGDEELIRISTLAKAKSAEINKGTRITEELLAKLRRVPTEQYEKNKGLYQQLVDLHPDNETYKNKVSFYSKKIDEEVQKKLAAGTHEKHLDGQLSAREGSHKGSGQSIMVRIAVFDDTQKRPVHAKAEIWFRGHGSWWLKPEVKFGSTVKDIGTRPSGRQQTLIVYPESRNGTELKVPYMMTDEMNPKGSTRDMISVDISDTEITVHGLPIKAATGKFEMKYRR